MKKLSKVITAVLIAVMALGLFSGCSTEKEKDTEDKILTEIEIGGPVEDGPADEKKILKYMKNRYGLEFKITATAGPTEDYPNTTWYYMSNANIDNPCYLEIWYNSMQDYRNTDDFSRAIFETKFADMLRSELGLDKDELLVTIHGKVYEGYVWDSYSTVKAAIKSDLVVYPDRTLTGFKVNINIDKKNLDAQKIWDTLNNITAEHGNTEIDLVVLDNRLSKVRKQFKSVVNYGEEFNKAAGDNRRVIRICTTDTGMMDYEQFVDTLNK